MSFGSKETGLSQDAAEFPRPAEAWGLPAEWPAELSGEIADEVRRSDQKVVVLDDDPTGTQTVHGVPVLTRWDAKALEAEMRGASPAFYILTNTRSMAKDAACRLNWTIARNLNRAAGKAGKAFVVVSRSDSTLRGHFPDEVEVLASLLKPRPRAVLLIPSFFECGRLTVRDVHYVDTNGVWVPAGETEFARDQAFGYRSSNLRQWVEEKSGGRILAQNVASISVEEMRLGGPDAVRIRLSSLEAGCVCVVNAATQRDLQVFTLGLLRAESSGTRFLCRTAASFVACRIAIDPRPLVAPDELALADGGGLIVAGSHVPRTTAQLDGLIRSGLARAIQFDANCVLDPGMRREEIRRTREAAEACLVRGDDALIFTSREVIESAGPERSLLIGQMISKALVRIVRGIKTRPRYLLAKGGITSSDIATRALNVERALVIGQAAPGVPVWRLGPESRFPDLPYLVFPGNVGNDGSLVEIVRRWQKRRAAAESPEAPR